MSGVAVEIGNLTVKTRVKVPTPPASRLPKGAGSGQVASKSLVASGSATIEKSTEDGTSVLLIEQDRRLVDLLSLQSEQGGSERLPDFDHSNAFRGSDIKGVGRTCPCWVPATNNAPKRFLPRGKAVLG